MPNVPCRFWQQGNCRNGDNCKFEHAPVNRGVPNGNRFAPLQTPNNSRNAGNNGGSSTSQSVPFQLDKAAIITDLSSERPQWILSAYGPGRHAPAQLFGGPLREQSFEEMRLMHYIGLASGNPLQAVQETEKLTQAAEQQIQTALNNVDGAIEFIIKSQNEHPNRIDIVRDSQSGGPQPNPFGNSAPSQSTQMLNPFGRPTPASIPFGAPSQPTSNPFGAPSQATQISTPFGAPTQPASTTAFGAPSQPGAFGQPSALGQKPNPFGAAPTPTFGGPSQLGSGGGAFGRPSALGQKPNPFGAPSGGTTSGSTQSAPFSAFSGPSNPFGPPPTTSAPNPFGAPTQPVTSNPFNPQPVTAFGVPSGQNSNSSQPNPFGRTSTAPFGAPSLSPKNPFGTIPQPTDSNPFNGTPTPPQPNPFGASPANPSPFGGPSSNPPANANPFGNVPPGGQTANSNPFSQPGPLSGANGAFKSGPVAPISTAPISAGHPPINSYSSKDASGRLTMFKGKRVQYQDGQAGVQNRDGSWAKIWFPDGPPRDNKDTEMGDSAYDEKTKQAYMYLRQNGSFQGGVIPLVPPKREWCSWDF